ncbi:hypothetical protein CEP51_013024 [Fusarium floridanum]|uniref:Cell division cycle protein 123 n=2 Tax=Fusarium solani species complex TaxID=232080 RepID=A0A428QIZ6_9HYPO|nr:hypothetical protein CEP51_013024 [Fusarium floridanum]RSM15524.1 hypothetical protein CDV31_004960 [Fusarium ambrosium]
MKLVKINLCDVTDDCRDGRATRFNTCFHPADQLPANVSRPSEAPYSFTRWLPLILQIRNIDPTAVQTVRLSRAQARLLVDASTTSIITGEMNRAFEEDLREDVFPAFSSLKFPPEGLFMRLTGCSPKDGRWRDPTRPSLDSTDDIILRLTTSERARNDIVNSLESGSETVNITFLPFDARMDSRREYRVPWLFDRRPGTTLKAVVDKIWAGIVVIHRHIVNDLKPDTELDNLLLQQGFTFDVLYDEDKEAMELVELNVFGARSGCGSCLFNWVNDFSQLYGEGEDVEFRVTW